ncbi:Chemotaxis protein CheV [hydrothermal vent metagenome]|uniref:Chemotaxis protein CheV n=1 Tax=hydrothermal vent metagenome TaxID=652676 RepID=A0A3B1BLN7_9ZZZZ
MDRREILLESGTNEIEFVEFMLGAQNFGVNVAKVREILSYDPNGVTAVPVAYHTVMGMFILRDSTVPLIDLKLHMGTTSESENKDRKVILVCEFNDMVNGFLVDGVNQIHRSSWKDILPISQFISQYGPSITSSITINGRNILMIDLEHVLSDIYPETRLVYQEEEEDTEHTNDTEKRHNERENVYIVVAEDSPIVRSSIKKICDDVGYQNIRMFDNGLDAYNHVLELADRAKNENRNLTDLLAALVTDIEMPKMDGLTLCRNIKEDKSISSLPVIVFSSLVNEQMIAKCKTVGADGWANKLKIAELIYELDKHCLDQK